MIISLKSSAQKLSTDNSILIICVSACGGLYKDLIFHSNLELKLTRDRSDKYHAFQKKKCNQFYIKNTSHYASMFNEIYISEMNYNLLCDYIIKQNIEKEYGEKFNGNTKGFMIRIYKNGQKEIQYIVTTPDELNEYLTNFMKIINNMQIKEDDLNTINYTFGYRNGRYLGSIRY